MWERFSYYGMRALLMLFMTTPLANGGFGFNEKYAASIYGAYTGSVYLMSIPGGWIADNVLGTRMAVMYGGVIIALGHFSMAAPHHLVFFSWLNSNCIWDRLIKTERQCSCRWSLQP